MTVEKINWFKRNGMSLSTLLIVMGILVNSAFWKQRVDDRLENVENHTTSEVVHMPLEDKINMLVWDIFQVN